MSKEPVSLPKPQSTSKLTFILCRRRIHQAGTLLLSNGRRTRSSIDGSSLVGFVMSPTLVKWGKSSLMARTVKTTGHGPRCKDKGFWIEQHGGERTKPDAWYDGLADVLSKTLNIVDFKAGGKTNPIFLRSTIIGNL